VQIQQRAELVVLLLCGDCNLGPHTFCLDPPLARMPAGDWFDPHFLITVDRRASPDSRRIRIALPVRRQTESTDPAHTATCSDAETRVIDRTQRSAESRSEGRRRIQIDVR
jgi:hypothetical protein